MRIRARRNGEFGVFIGGGCGHDVCINDGNVVELLKDYGTYCRVSVSDIIG